MINLAVTTRQLNPGDDFVLNGVRNLFPKANWAVYNRNPDNKLVMGNHWTGHSLSAFDNLVVAGSPQWYGNSVKPLFESLIKHPIPIYFIGIGIGESGELNLSPLDLTVLRMAKVITTRGEKCKSILLGYGIESEALPCPALFAEDASPISSERVGCVLTAKRKFANSSNSKEGFVARQLNLYKQLNPSEIIVHSIDEIEFAKQHFETVLYSYDPRDYKEIYDNYGILVSSRLHGAIFGMSLGRPAILIDTGSKRCQDAAPQFSPLIFCAPELVLKRMKDIKWEEKLEEVIEFKRSMMERYKGFIHV